MRTLLTALSIVLALQTASAADSYPSRVIRIVVPTVAGGTTDLLARMLADYIGTKSGAQCIVENRPGAAGSLGMESVAKSNPDGYTLGFHNTGLIINPLLRKAKGFDPLADLIPVGPVGEAPQLLVVNADLPVNSLSDFIALVKSQPGKFNYGSAGAGSTPHLAGDLFARVAGLEMAHIPYRGTSPAVVDVVRGNVQMISISLGPVAGFVEAKKLRVLAAATSKRIRFLPDIPTAAEAGLAGYEMTTWFGLFAPRGTPSDIISRLNSYIADMLDDPESQKRLVANSVEAMRMSSEEYQSFLAQDSSKWQSVITQSGIELH